MSGRTKQDPAGACLPLLHYYESQVLPAQTHLPCHFSIATYQRLHQKPQSWQPASSSLGASAVAEKLAGICICLQIQNKSKHSRNHIKIPSPCVLRLKTSFQHHPHVASSSETNAGMATPASLRIQQLCRTSFRQGSLLPPP